MTKPSPKESHFICLTGDPAKDGDHLLMDHRDTVLHAPSGTFIRTPDGVDVSMTVPVISGVAISDWAEVADHQTARDEATVSHCLRFHGGGELNVVFNLQGQILSLSGKGLVYFADWSGFITVGPHLPDESAAG